MGKNFISQYRKTEFYVDLVNKQYGVCINIKDIDNAEEIIEYFYNNEINKKCIRIWSKLWEEDIYKKS